MENKKIIFGLTGNMGCGKSTIANLLSGYDDVYVFDCDSVAKEILEDNKNLGEIKLILGEEIIVNNKIDKQKVSQIIFNNNEKKQKLESFIHPKVWEKLSEIINMSKDGTIFVVESAILFEIGKEKEFKKIILVTCDKDEQVKRIKLKTNWTDEQIEERLKNQLPDEFKKTKSLVTISTNCSLEELKQKTEKLYSYMRNDGDYKLIL